MPWCDSCDKYVDQSDVAQGETCPTCANELDTSDRSAGTQENPKAPWHFKLMLALLIAYLGWRLVQFIIWIVT